MPDAALAAPAPDILHPTARCCWCQGLFRRLGSHWICCTPACAQRQHAHAVVAVGKGKGGKTRILYLPLPVQVNFHACRAKNVLFGGAAAGTKSHALRWDAYLRCLAVPGYRVLILRRTFPELMDTHIERFMVDVPLLGGEYLKSEYKARFPNGSILQAGHMAESDSYTKYLSTEFDAIYPDELVTFEERPMLMIMSRARSTKPGVTPVFRAGTNPGGPGAHWIKRRFLDKDVTPEESKGYQPEDWTYIPATLDDNPYIDADYESRLDALPEELRRAYRYGDWDIFPGQFFTEWRAARHVIEDVYIDPSVPRVRAVDWGYSKPGVCLWLALLPDGRVVLEEEYKFQQTTVSEVAKEIVRRTKARGLSRVRYTVGDTQMWAHSGQVGETMAETFARFGVPMQQANKDRVNGWQRLRHWLRDAPDKSPWLQVAKTCTYTCRTIPALVMDHNNPEDVDSDGDDHAADALRYFCMSRPAPVQEKKAERIQPGSIAAMKRLFRHNPVLGSEAVRAWR